MIMLWRSFIILLFQVIIFSSVAATYDVVVNQEVNVTSQYSILAPQYVDDNIHQIFNLPNSTWVLQQQPLMLNRGQNWVAIDIMNRSEQEAKFYLVLNNGLQIQALNIYERGYGNAIKITDITRHYNSLSSARLKVSPKSTWRIYLAVTSEGNASLNVDILSPSEFISALSHSQYFSGISIGGMFALAFVMLMLFTASGSKSLLILCGYFTVKTLSLSVLLGINLYSFFPTAPELRGLEIPLLTSVSGILFIWFTYELFKLKRYSLQLSRTLMAIGWLLFIYLPVSMLLDLNDNLFICKIIEVVIAAVLIAVGLFLVKQKQRLAVLFSGIILLHLVFIVANIMTDTWYGFNTTLYTFSYWLHGFLITFILSRQYYYQNLDSEKAQKESLESASISRQAQEELLTLQKENQEQLEIRVQERTLELNIALQELENANQELAEKNTLDDLTGLFNRRHYDQKIVAEFRRSRRNLTPLSIVVIDIDHFKSVNDTYGHLAGDNCLITLAKIIKESMRRSTDIGCRYGGEEFCLILPETDNDGAFAMAEELRLAVIKANFFVNEASTISLSISCGIATYQQQKSLSPEALFSAADKALYQAKDQGRDQVVISELDTSI